MFNHVGLLGRLAQEPEIRYTQGGSDGKTHKVVEVNASRLYFADSGQGGSGDYDGSGTA